MSNSMTKEARLQLLKSAHAKVVRRKQREEREIEKWMPTENDLSPLSEFDEKYPDYIEPYHYKRSHS